MHVRFLPILSMYFANRLTRVSLRCRPEVMNYRLVEFITTVEDDWVLAKLCLSELTPSLLSQRMKA